MRKLVWMAEAKQREQQHHTAQMLAMTANCHLGEKQAPYTPDFFNPYVNSEHKPTAKEKADQSLLDKYVS